MLLRGCQPKPDHCKGPKILLVMFRFDSFRICFLFPVQSVNGNKTVGTQKASDLFDVAQCHGMIVAWDVVMALWRLRSIDGIIASACHGNIPQICSNYFFVEQYHLINCAKINSHHFLQCALKNNKKSNLQMRYWYDASGQKKRRQVSLRSFKRRFSYQKWMPKNLHQYVIYLATMLDLAIWT